MTTINNNYSNYSSQAPKQDPNAYAQQYADQNGLTLEEAKAELKSKYGDPSEGTQIPNLDNNSSSIFSSNDSSENTLNLDSDVSNVTLTDDITSDSKSLLKYIIDLFKSNNDNNGEEADPDEIAQEYADAKGITLDEAKEELKEIGEPQRMNIAA